MKNGDATSAMFRVMREAVLDADAETLDLAVKEAGIDPNDLTRAARAAIDRAIAVTADDSADSDIGDLHEGLSALLQLLRRRHSLSHEQLAHEARIEADEIRRIETEVQYTPKPRTIYQLEQFFKLPKRSLAKLAGLTRQRSAELKDEALQFAASSKAMHKLTRAEERILNAFVKFLGKDAEAEET
jgi:ribosome-binding protein aMBF1 (putative translation factor)